MSKFNVGDRIVIVQVGPGGEGDGGLGDNFYAVGDVGTVVEAAYPTSDPYVQFDEPFTRGDGNWWVSEADAELLPINTVNSVGPGTPGADVRSLLAQRDFEKYGDVDSEESN